MEKKVSFKNQKINNPKINNHESLIRVLEILERMNKNIEILSNEVEHIKKKINEDDKTEPLKTGWLF